MTNRPYIRGIAELEVVPDMREKPASAKRKTWKASGEQHWFLRKLERIEKTFKEGLGL